MQITSRNTRTHAYAYLHKICIFTYIAHVDFDGFRDPVHFLSIRHVADVGPAFSTGLLDQLSCLLETCKTKITAL